MTTEERVLTALGRGQPDRVPVFLFLNPYAETPRTESDPSYAEVLEACKEYEDVVSDWAYPHGLFYTEAKIDTERRPLEDGSIETTLHTPAGPLTAIERSNWRGGGQTKRFICGPQDLERALSVPYVPSRPDVRPFLAEKARLAGKAVAQVTFSDPMCSADWIDESALAFMTVEERPLLKRFLDAMYVRVADALRYCLSNSVGPLYYFNGPEYALPPLMSPDDFEEFVVEYDRRLIGLVHERRGMMTIVHSHGRVSDFLERFVAMGTDGLNVLEPPPIGNVVLEEAKRRVGDRICLIGNIQYDDLARGTPDSVEKLVRESMRQGAPGGGFILCPCASPYEPKLTQQASTNFIRYLTAARRWGTYQL
jgi:hypothetical protein